MADGGNEHLTITSCEPASALDMDQGPTDAAGATVWTYDPVGNSLNFEPAYVPGPGQTITITYTVACFP